MLTRFVCVFVYVSRKSRPSNLGLVACCAACHSCFHWHSDWAAVPLHVFQLDITSNHAVWNLKGSLSLFIHPGNMGNKTLSCLVFCSWKKCKYIHIFVRFAFIRRYKDQSNITVWRFTIGYTVQIDLTRDFILKGKNHFLHKKSISRLSEEDPARLNRCPLQELWWKKAEHPVVGLNNPKGLHFTNHNRGVIYVPVTRHDLDPDWAPRRHAIDPHSQESQLPLKLWQWNCTASIGSAGSPPYYL